MDCAAAADRHALEQLAHLVEEHDGHALPVLPRSQGAHRGQRHEKVLVKYLAVLMFRTAFHKMSQPMRA